MKEERKTINPKADVIIASKYVKPCDLKILPKDFQGNILIYGSLVIEDEDTIKFDNLYAKRLISNGPKVNIIGNIYIENDIDVFDIKVNGSVYCGENFNSAQVVISEDFTVDGDVDANYHSIIVGGDFVCGKSIENVEALKVLGKLKVDVLMKDITGICIG